MAYQIVQRETIKWGVENYPPGSPGLNASNRAPYSDQPGLEWANNGDLLIYGSRATGHDSIPSVPSLWRSTDKGRTWPHIRDELIVDNPNPAYRIVGDNICRRRYGSSAGRIIVMSQQDTLASSVTPWLNYSDDDAHTFSARIAMPLPPQQAGFTRFLRPFEDARTPGRLYFPIYYYTATTVRKVSALYYCDDPDFGPGSITFLSTIWDRGTGGSEAKEPNICVLDDGRWICMIRLADTEQQIWSTYSSDFGVTWSTPTFAFDGMNDPRVKQMRNGDVLVVTRKKNTNPGVLDGDSHTILLVSHNRGATWDAPIEINDPTIDSGQGANVAGDTIQLDDSTNRIGLVHVQARAATPYATSLLQFLVLDPSPPSSGEFVSYCLDPVYRYKHPSAYIDPTKLWGWYHMEQLRKEYAQGANVTRWRNALGLPSRDLVWSGQETAAVLQDGSDFSTGLVGGLGLAQNHGQGGGNFRLDVAAAFPQPFSVIIVADAAAESFAGVILDDGSGMQVRWNGTAFTTSLNGVTVTWTGGWTGGPAIFTMIYNGAASALRINSAALSAASGGPIGATSATTIRINGPGNAGFLSGIRELAILTAGDTSQIGSLETAWLAKHRVLG